MGIRTFVNMKEKAAGNRPTWQGRGKRCWPRVMDMELNGHSTSYNGHEGKEGWRLFLIESEIV